MRISRTAPFATLIVLALLSAPLALAQSTGQTRWRGPALDDRRFLQIFVYDAAVVENAWIEGQLQIQSDTTPIGGDGADTLRLGPVLAFSPVDRLEIGGRLDFLDVDFDRGGSESGLSDTLLYGKWQFFHNPIQFALGLELSLPSGDKDSLLGTGEVGYALFGSVRKNLEEAYLTGYFGFRGNRDADVGRDLTGNNQPIRLDGKTSIFLGGGVMFPMSERWALSGELEVETERYENADSLVEITGGAYWYASQNVTLRGGLGIGLDDGAPDWEFIFGVAWHF